MAHILLIVIFVVSFSVPALAAKRYYNRGSPDDCRIVNIAPGYTKTKVRKGKRVYVTRPTAAVEHGHYLQAGSRMARLTARESRRGLKVQDAEVNGASPSPRRQVCVHMYCGFGLWALRA